MLTLKRRQRVAVLCSKRSPGLDVVLRHPRRKKLFDVVCVITTDTEFLQRDLVESYGIPVFTHPLRQFHRDRGAKLSDAAVRREYDEITVAQLRKLEVDVVILAGYLYIVSDAMLHAFPDRVINVHDSDLSVLDIMGEPRYVGLRSTFDAISDGVTSTRSTVHFVNSRLDAGPILLVSNDYAVAPFAQKAAACGERDIVKAYAYAQREWMMRECWGHLLVRALELLAAADESIARPVTPEELAQRNDEGHWTCDESNDADVAVTA